MSKRAHSREAWLARAVAGVRLCSSALNGPHWWPTVLQTAGLEIEKMLAAVQSYPEGQ